ncbi:MAG: sugar phosphate isomerase/epimerase [Caldilineales bacterium]|nr:sugar phosphate isomerase/epimerase [Caldilineales bacterium]
MLPSIAVQLYSLRYQLADDFAGVIEQLAQIGFAGVETAMFPGTSPAEAAKLFSDLGLAVCASHVPLPIGEDLPKALDILKPLNSRRAVCAWQPSERFSTLAEIDRLADELNQAADNLAEHGIDFFYHNHEFEFQIVDGQPAYYHFIDRLQPDVFLELDIYWTQTAGIAPVALLRELGGRASLVHMKDGACVRGVPMVALGEGDVKLDEVIAVAKGPADWLIVELDECGTDMMEAVAKSFAFLDERLS